MGKNHHWFHSVGCWKGVVVFYQWSSSVELHFVSILHESHEVFFGIFILETEGEPELEVELDSASSSMLLLRDAQEPMTFLTCLLLNP